ncbi:MAG: CpaF family protein [Candidatus Omnitrophota bacterium]|jgi:pilus assembly protein CpaF|nr:MAG: CpaF family protein [Candidatus Omnitrophota bacterium]
MRLVEQNSSERTAGRKAMLQKIKSDVHRRLIDRLDLGQINDENKETVMLQVRPLVADLISSQPAPLNGQERNTLVDEVLDEVFGFGPLETLLKDPQISDILINNHKEIYIEKQGKLQKSEISFRDDRHLLQIIDRIVSRIGRRVDETSPMVDARLPDGSRVNAIIPPLALNGPAMSIRRFGVNPLKLDDLIDFGAMTTEMVEFLEGAVRAKQNIIISGGTGSGKTTLLNILTSFIPPDERIITIEDAAELILQQPHVVRLETRPPNIEGHGAITQRDLLFNTLRMRPDRIILGEVRGAEALDMLQAMNTGHEGSLTTIHANTPRDGLSRIEMMVSMSGIEIPVRVVRQQISSAIDLIVQASRLIDGSRRITSIAEVVGMEGEVVTMQEIFKFKQDTVDAKGKVHGAFIATGVRPKAMTRIEAAGIRLSAELFYPGEKLRVGGA